MGANWAPLTAMPPEDEVKVAKMGPEVLIFIGTRPFDEREDGLSWCAILDKEYRLGATNHFVRLTANRLKLTVTAETLERWEKVYLGRGERSYLIDLPRPTASPPR